MRLWGEEAQDAIQVREAAPLSLGPSPDHRETLVPQVRVEAAEAVHEAQAHEAEEEEEAMKRRRGPVAATERGKALVRRELRKRRQKKRKARRGRPDMTDLVLSNPDLVRDVMEADRELREGKARLLSWDEVERG